MSASVQARRYCQITDIEIPLLYTSFTGLCGFPSNGEGGTFDIRACRTQICSDASEKRLGSVQAQRQSPTTNSHRGKETSLRRKSYDASHCGAGPLFYLRRLKDENRMVREEKSVRVEVEATMDAKMRKRSSGATGQSKVRLFGDSGDQCSTASH